MRRWLHPLACAMALLLSLPLAAQPGGGMILMGSTIGPIDSGIVAALELAFERESGIRVRHVGAGTGAALDIARQGSVDLVLVHARSLEEKFVAEGFGIERVPLMYNDFVIVGPAADPAGIKGAKSALDALRSLAAKAAPFVSRGDHSGTHVAEQELWAKAGLQPAGSWYRIFDRGAEGNIATLLFTEAQQAYTIIDRASYLGARDRVKLAVLVEGDEVLLNHISMILVNPAKCPRVDLKSATAFLDWLTAVDKGQKLIAEFGKAQFGQALFIPESKAWMARKH